MTAALEDRSAQLVLAAAHDALRARRAAEVAEMRVVAHWVAMHGEPRHERDPMTTPGGEGTPAVREYALPELAMARETHALTTRALAADTLDLQHRLPRTWAVVEALECEPWVARKVAALSRALPAATVGIVDAAVAAAIAGHAPSTVLEIAHAKVIEADPETYAMRREAEKRRRYVALSRTDEHGLRVVIARTTAGEAVWVDAMVDRVADILAATHGHDHSRDELRSLAFGWLARPADLLKLLLDHTGVPQEPAPGEEPGQPVWAPDHLPDTAKRLASLSPRQLAAMRGRAQVFVHLSEAALLGQAGLARVEGHGPVLVTSLADLIGHADVRLTPVRDLRHHTRVDTYEHPTALKDQVWLLTGGEVFPFSPRTATRDDVDFDHTHAYDDTGPPGQTGTHNSGPLRRRHHRWKTHGGFRCRPAGPGRHLWQTPHGDCYLLDRTGTTRLTQTETTIHLTAPHGLDVYTPRFEVRWSG
jgi:hypothetical protein